MTDLERLKKIGETITAMQKNQFRTGMRLVRQGIGHYVIVRDKKRI